MCQIWLRSDGRVEKKEGVQTDRQRDTAALYLVDNFSLPLCPIPHFHISHAMHLVFTVFIKIEKSVSGFDTEKISCNMFY